MKDSLEKNCWVMLLVIFVLFWLPLLSEFYQLLVPVGYAGVTAWYSLYLSQVLKKINARSIIVFATSMSVFFALHWPVFGFSFY